MIKEFGISINVVWLVFLVPFGRLVGHIVSEQGIATDHNKIATIKGDEAPVWTTTFNTLKRKLVTAPILIPPNWKNEFKIYVDASNVAIGSVLSKKNEKRHDHHIYFASRQLVQAKRNYTIIEREALGMIFSIQDIFAIISWGTNFFSMSIRCTQYMINKPQLNGRIARWVLLLQEFNFTVEVRPGKSHANVDHLSRSNEESGSEAIGNSFPYARLIYLMSYLLSMLR